MRPVRCPRHHPQPPADLGKQLVRLPVIAFGAASHAVRPAVGTTSAARDDVIDRLGAASAVGAAVPVAMHEPGPCQRYLRTVGHAHVGTQPDHRRNGQRNRGGVHFEPTWVAVHHLGLATHHEDHRAPQRQRRQRFERGVQQQYPSTAPGRRRGRTGYRRSRRVPPSTLSGRAGNAPWPRPRPARWNPMRRGASRMSAQHGLRRLSGQGLARDAEGDGLSVWHSTTSTGAGIVDHRSAPKCTCVTRRVTCPRPRGHSEPGVSKPQGD